MESFENVNHQHTDTSLDHQVVHEQIFIQCPECEKRFVVNCLDIENEMPEFVCNQCDNPFFVDINVEEFTGTLMGQPISHKPQSDATNQDVEFYKDNREQFELKKEPSTEPAAETQLCPKCNTEYLPNQPECFRCGLIFEKTTAKDSGTLVPASDELKLAWEKLIINFTNTDLHDAFIQRSLDEKNLKYAAYRYGLLKKTNPEDDITLAMLERVEKMAEATSGIQNQTKKKQRSFGWLAFFVILSVALIAMGSVFQQFRNLVGVGVALLFLIVAMRVLFYKTQN